MKMIVFLLIFSFNHSSTRAQNPVPTFLHGNFTDDYGIRYSISDSLFIQWPGSRYHIIKVDTVGQFIVAQNDTANKFAKGLYTRIDFMYFKNMAPYTWGFCLSAYEEADALAAENTPPADRKNPRKGCSGYPFSRMKPTEGN